MLMVFGIVVVVLILYAWYFHDTKAAFWRRLTKLTQNGTLIVYGEDQARGTMIFGVRQRYEHFKYYSGEYRCGRRIELAFQETMIVRRRAKQEAMTLLIEELTRTPRKFWISECDEVVGKVFSQADDLAVWYDPETDHVSKSSCYPFLNHVQYSLGQLADRTA